jgi:hypothetical protein
MYAVNGDQATVVTILDSFTSRPRGKPATAAKKTREAAQSVSLFEGRHRIVLCFRRPSSVSIAEGILPRTSRPARIPAVFRKGVTCPFDENGRDTVSEFSFQLAPLRFGLKWVLARLHFK